MARLRTHVRVGAYLRRCQSEGAFATIMRKGDPDAGIVIIRSYRPGGSTGLFMETRDAAGAPAWRRLGTEEMDEVEADRLIAREIGFDPDLWVVEVEDRDGRVFLDDPIIE